MGIKTAAAIAAVALIALAGCSAAPAPAETSTATPAPDTASVERWAGLVAERQFETDDWLEDWDDRGCSGLQIANPACNVTLTSAAFIAQTTHLVIAGPSDPAARTYLGEVPAEIDDLYAATIKVTQEADDAATAWLDAKCADGREECVKIAIDLERAIDATRTKFAAWSPYL